MAPLDPNVQAWQRAIEADAAAHFPGEPDPRPFGRCLYLWGEVAVYSVEFGGWTPLSAAVVVKRLIEARAQADEFTSAGPVAQ
jgi:hypothetical protein